MAEPEFPIVDELRFLALQCDAQVASTHRDQDRAFIQTMAGVMYQVGGCDMLQTVAGMIADAADPLRHPDGLPGVIKSRAVILRELADIIERSTANGRAA